GRRPHSYRSFTLAEIDGAVHGRPRRAISRDRTEGGNPAWAVPGGQRLYRHRDSRLHPHGPRGRSKDSAKRWLMTWQIGFVLQNRRGHPGSGHRSYPTRWDWVRFAELGYAAAKAAPGTMTACLADSISALSCWLAVR